MGGVAASTELRAAALEAVSDDPRAEQLEALRLATAELAQVRAVQRLPAVAGAGHLVTPYYSATRDGKRFLLSQLVQHGGETPLTVLVDWPARLMTR